MLSLFVCVYLIFIYSITITCYIHILMSYFLVSVQEYDERAYKAKKRWLVENTRVSNKLNYRVKLATFKTCFILKFLIFSIFPSFLINLFGVLCSIFKPPGGIPAVPESNTKMELNLISKWNV